MARRTRGNILLNAYANRYVNEQASNVNRGQSNIASAKTQGAQQISAVPTDLPELTDYSRQVYDSILQHEKDRQAAYKKAVEEAQKAAEAAQKAAARSARSSSRRSSGGGSGKSSGGSSDEAAVLPGTDTETVAAEETTSKAKKGAAPKKNVGRPQKKTVEEVARELDRKQDAAKTARSNETRYAAQGGRGARTQSTDVGLASSYGAYAQARAARDTKTAQTEREQEREAQRQRSEEARQRTAAYNEQRERARQEITDNLALDSTYAQNLAQPGVRLDKDQIEAVQEYLDEQGSDYEYSRELWDRRNAGELTTAEVNELLSTRNSLKNKVSFGGFGQDLQAFAAGVANAIPFLDDITEGFESVADDATGGRYREIVGGTTPSEALENTEQQNPVAGVAGRFAGNALLYTGANAALEGTRFANAASAAGQRAAGALSRVPGLNRFSTQGMGNAIGNIITGQSVDLALDTIPNLANDISEGATAQEAAANAAQNFGVNLAMNVGSEAIPALWNAGRNAVKNAAENARAARGVQEAVDTDNARAMVDAYENANLPDSSVLDADAAAEGVLSY
ncbi:MAG TPA: hypothetical protein H9810_01145 [Candidatus Gemmiger excrementavium]|uniref:Uncharacterized protein n=1 Tax=Candidatus Gemmiger excrementavium TaxID=2838608 RepID=A0A9D2F1F4_9FIRM|nr:hypothetical protein [Candidatus Gemmiger excrementavium]